MASVASVAIPCPSSCVCRFRDGLARDHEQTAHSIMYSMGSNAWARRVMAREDDKQSKKKSRQQGAPQGSVGRIKAHDRLSDSVPRHEDQRTEGTCAVTTARRPKNGGHVRRNHVCRTLAHGVPFSTPFSTVQCSRFTSLGWRQFLTERWRQGVCAHGPCRRVRTQTMSACALNPRTRTMSVCALKTRTRTMSVFA